MNSKESQAETTAQESTTAEDNNVKPHLHKTNVGRSASKTPLEMCWYLRNFFGTTLNRYDKADECGIFLCEMLMPYVANDKMVDDVDDDCTQYWGKVIQYLKDGR